MKNKGVVKSVIPFVNIAVFACMQAMILTAPPAIAGDNKQEKLEQLNSEMQSLKKLLTEFKKTRSTLQNELRKSELKIGKLQTRIKTIEQRLNQQKQKLGQLQAQRHKLQTAQKQQQKYIGQQIFSAYQIGQQKKIKVLLNQEDPEKVSRSLNYYDYFNRARSAQIEQYINIISELDSLEPEIAKTTKNLSDSRQTLLNEQNNLLESKTKRKQNLAKINTAIKNKDQQLRKAAKDRAELEQLLATMKQSISNINTSSDYLPFKTLRGKLPWPVDGKPSNRFGGRRSGSDIRWKGLSIPAREGVEVKAIHHGRVIFADWLRGSGLLVIIDHGDGYMSLYAHNQSLLRETGDWVNTGEPVATVGNSGGQQSSNLYFEIRHNGQPTDPRKWCKRG